MSSSINVRMCLFKFYVGLFASTGSFNLNFKTAAFIMLNYEHEKMIRSALWHFLNIILLHRVYSKEKYKLCFFFNEYQCYFSKTNYA